MQDQADKSDATRRRTLFEAFAWAVLIAFLWTADTLGKLSYRKYTGIGQDNFRLVLEQATSAIAVLVMVLFVVYWLRLFPIRKDQWASAIIGHTIGSIMFAFGHHVLMIVQRTAVFSINGMTYHWQGGFASNLIIEYQKDIKIYIGIVAIVSAYQYYRRTHTDSSPRGSVANRLVVQTGTGEAFVAYDEIEYIEASRNYVEVHVGQKHYLARDSLANMEERLAGRAFARCHRRFIVNLDRVAELKTIDGSPQIHLKSGAVLPVGRSYRDAFKSSIAAGHGNRD